MVLRVDTWTDLTIETSTLVSNLILKFNKADKQKFVSQYERQFRQAKELARLKRRPSIESESDDENKDKDKDQYKDSDSDDDSDWEASEY